MLLLADDQLHIMESEDKKQSGCRAAATSSHPMVIKPLNYKNKLYLLFTKVNKLSYIPTLEITLCFDGCPLPGFFTSSQDSDILSYLSD